MLSILQYFTSLVFRSIYVYVPDFFSHFTSIIIHVSKSAIDSNKYLGCPQQYLNEILNFGPLCRGYEEQQPIQQQQPSRPRPVYPNPSPKRTIDTKRKAVSTRYLLVDTIQSQIMTKLFERFSELSPNLYIEQHMSPQQNVQQSVRHKMLIFNANLLN